MRTKVLNFIEKENMISNIEEYRKIFTEHYNLKSMVKIDPQKAKEFVYDNRNEIKRVCDENHLSLDFDEEKIQFTIGNESGVTTLNRILSERSGFNLREEFITFPTFKKHSKKQKKAKNN